MDNLGRVVAITGGSRGIGRAVALRFTEEKAKIVIVHYDLDELAANDTLNLLTKQGVECESHKVDVSNYADAESLFQDILARFQC